MKSKQYRIAVVLAITLVLLLTASVAGTSPPQPRPPHRQVVGVKEPTSGAEQPVTLDGSMWDGSVAVETPPAAPHRIERDEASTPAAPLDAPAQEIEGDGILLKVGYIDTATRPTIDKENIEVGRTLMGLAPDEDAFYLVQFYSPVQEAWKRALEEAGAQLFNYVPRHAFIVKMTPDVAEKVVAIEEVRWVGLYWPEYKVQPALAERVTATTQPITVTVMTFEGAAVLPLTEAVEAMGGTVLRRSAGQHSGLLRVRAEADLILQLARRVEVQWIEPYVPWQLSNDVARGSGLMNVDTVHDTYGLTGAGQIIGHADTGIDVGINDARLHDDLEGRILAAYAWGRDFVQISHFNTPKWSAHGVAWDGNRLWHSDSYTDLIYKLDTSGNEVASFPSPGSVPRGLTWDGANLWLIDSGIIYKLDTAGNVLDSFPGPSIGTELDLTWDGSNLWISVCCSVFYKVDTDGTVLDTISTGGHINGLAWNGTTFWATDFFDDLIYEVDTGGTVLRSFPAPDHSPEGLAFDAANNRLWLVAGFNDMYQLATEPGWSDPDGHGTHTAGSIVGTGAAFVGSGVPGSGQYHGVAPDAQLVHQSVMDDDGGLGGIPADIGVLFQQAYDDGARIHSDSWGAPVGGGYTADAVAADSFAWDHKDMLLVFSAGNQGTDDDNDGVVDLDGIDSPATAKNVLAVGASENDRGGIGHTWGEFWPSSFSTNPIHDDQIANHPDGLAAFSSRGPTDDGRIKPDIVAPGTYIVSTRSHQWAFEDDMESGVGAWNPASPWSQTTDDAHSGSTSWHAGNADGYLTSDSLDILTTGSGATLGFWTRYDLGSVGKATVRWSDDGSNWYWFGSTELTGTQAGWTYARMDIPIFSGYIDNLRQVQLRFSLETGEGLQILSSFSARGTYPSGLTWDGNALWQSGSSDLYHVDTGGGLLDSIDAPYICHYGTAWDGTHIWTVSACSDQVYRVDTSGNVISSFATPGGYPTGLTWDGSHLWLADERDDRIYKLTTSGTVVASFASPGLFPTGLAWDGTYLWHSDTVYNEIYKLDTTGNVLATYDFPTGDSRDLAWDGTHLWYVDKDNDRVYQVGISTGHEETYWYVDDVRIFGSGWGLLSDEGAAAVDDQQDLNYLYMGGTSMATPLTAGAAALVRQYYTDREGINPSAALIKATLLNGATDLFPGQYGTGATQEIPIPRPNNVEGWGRVNLVDSLFPSSPRQLRYLDTESLQTGEVDVVEYHVTDNTEPLLVTLAWTDYPGAVSAAIALVNDLDLVVTSPGGATYLGNVFSGGWSATGGSPDRTNNIESVFVQSAEVGTWTVEVHGYNVPNGPQPYALVASGAIQTGACYDFDGSGTVDIADISRVASRWRTSCDNPNPDNDPDTPNYEALYDVNGDCIINIVDIMLVVVHWGETCG